MLAGSVSERGSSREDYSLESYDYELPPELIAQLPAAHREQSRLMVVDRARQTFFHERFSGVTRYLRAGDVLVVNDTRVVAARLVGRKASGGRVELLVLEPWREPGRERAEGHACLVKCAKKPRPGTRLSFPRDIRAEVVTVLEDGHVRVRFLTPEPLAQVLAKAGQVPLPPYIQRPTAVATSDDAERYQTVYAKRPGAVAAPTAGLHFTPTLLEKIAGLGVEVVGVTLHVGYGTFAPLRVQDIRDHAIHSEYAELSPSAAAQLSHAHAQGRRIVAVGTTVVRVLEWVMQQTGALLPHAGNCRHYIYPGYQFRAVQGLITNFHLPRSSLLLLVSAFAGRKRILAAYDEAIRLRYRFYSYGDAMLLL
jgi:S-adenosylmethionine:tRNA ribosyltransferase-isomerase